MIYYCISFRPDLLGLLTLIMSFRMPHSSNGTNLHVGNADTTVQEFSTCMSLCLSYLFTYFLFTLVVTRWQ